MLLDKREEIEIDDDKSKLDIDVLHAFLTESYWSKGIPKDIVEQSIDGSDCYGVYKDGHQIGYGRVITDGATFAYLCDVFILPEHQGQGLGKWLVEVIMAVPNYTKFRRWVLATRDAHELYKPFGFTALEDPSKFMEIRRPNSKIYSKALESVE